MLPNSQEFRETLKLGIPMAGAQLSQLAMSTTDVALVGRLQGEALAAMAVGQASYGFFLSLGIGMVSAVNPLVSQAHGANRSKEIAPVVVMGSVVAISCALFSWLFLYNIEALFATLAYEPEVAQKATGYTKAAMLGLPAAFLFFALKNYLDGVSSPRIPFLVALAGVVVNGIADYALMFGKWGLPELGVMGTGLATTVVNLFMALVLLVVAWKSEFTQALKPSVQKNWREFLSVGVPIAGSILLEVGLFVVAALLMGRLGMAEAAAHQIVLTCAAATFMVPLGISFAGGTRVGQAIGAREFERVRPAGLAAIIIGVGFMVFSAIAFIVIPEFFVAIFWEPSVEDDGRVKAFAIQLLFIAGIFQVFDGLQATSIGALRGMKDVNIPLLIGATSFWLIGLPSSYFMAFHTALRHEGMWWGLLLGLIAAGLGLFTRFWILSRRLQSDTELQQRVTVEALDS